MKSAQMLAITDFHTITHAMNASVNLTLLSTPMGVDYVVIGFDMEV